MGKKLTITSSMNQILAWVAKCHKSNLSFTEDSHKCHETLLQLPDPVLQLLDRFLQLPDRLLPFPDNP